VSSGSGPARSTSWWRYVPPNAVTAASLVLGVLAIQSAVRGRIVDAAWWGLLVTLTDKLDGLLANLLKSTSSFGVQMDSLADLLAFGAVPATVMYAFFYAHPELGWSAGFPYFALKAICAVYAVAVAVRLARFNVMATKGPHLHYSGTPSTMTAGMLMAFFLMCLKYADPSLTQPEALDSWRWLGPVRTDALVPYLPFTLLLGAFGMLSPLRVPRLGRARHRVTTVLLLSAVVFGYTVGVARRLPEYLFGGGVYYLGICIAYHLRTRRPAEAA
jgi:phosphatidylserine synthase